MEYSLLSTILNSHFHFISFYHINAYIVKTLSKSKIHQSLCNDVRSRSFSTWKLICQHDKKGQGRLQCDPRSRPSAAWPEVTGSRDCLDHLADHVVEDSAVSEVLEFHVRVKPGLHLERAAVTQLWRERREKG